MRDFKIFLVMAVRQFFSSELAKAVQQMFFNFGELLTATWGKLYDIFPKNFFNRSNFIFCPFSIFSEHGVFCEHRVTKRELVECFCSCGADESFLNNSERPTFFGIVPFFVEENFVWSKSNPFRFIKMSACKTSFASLRGLLGFSALRFFQKK